MQRARCLMTPHLEIYHLPYIYALRLINALHITLRHWNNTMPADLLIHILKDRYSFIVHANCILLKGFFVELQSALYDDSLGFA